MEAVSSFALPPQAVRENTIQIAVKTARILRFISILLFPAAGPFVEVWFPALPQPVSTYFLRRIPSEKVSLFCRFYYIFIPFSMIG
jgi:hypothetical protein